MVHRFSTQELEQMVVDFPYFAQAHVLLAKKYQLEAHPSFDAQLQLAALHSPDREILHELFNSEVVIESKESVQQSPVVHTAEQIIWADKAIAKDHVVPHIEDNAKQETAHESARAEIDMEEVTGEIVTVLIDAPANEQRTEEVAASLLKKEEEAIAEEEQATVIRKEMEEVQAIATSSNTIAPAESFDEQEPHSFGEWLSHFSSADKQSVFAQQPSPLEEASIENKTEEELDEELNRLIAANVPLEMVHERVESEAHCSKGLDDFIEQQKKRKQHSPFVTIEDELEESVVTETLAKILAAQGKIARAIRAYEILSLKNPRKKNSFAARIFELKNQL